MLDRQHRLRHPGQTGRTVRRRRTVLVCRIRGAVVQNRATAAGGGGRVPFQRAAKGGAALDRRRRRCPSSLFAVTTYPRGTGGEKREGHTQRKREEGVVTTRGRRLVALPFRLTPGLPLLPSSFHSFNSWSGGLRIRLIIMGRRSNTTAAPGVSRPRDSRSEAPRQVAGGPPLDDPRRAGWRRCSSSGS